MGRRKKGLDIDGWILLDKPADLTSTQAVSAVRRAF
ncbi:MAG TPA: tRNA pseudouridine(55) synthase TruB, partial [Alphaproteobacteria bacterium]|nr:tRNA pseudouridine(55) synthase TruB [Alphaproteobacteria bacterium]